VVKELIGYSQPLSWANDVMARIGLHLSS